MRRPLSLSYTVRAAAIRVVRVVVVDIAAGVDIPRIIRIAAIRRAQPSIHGAGTAYSLIKIRSLCICPYHFYAIL